MTKQDLIKRSVFVRMQIASDRLAGANLSYEDVQELMRFAPEVTGRAIRDAARAGYALDDEQGVVDAEAGYTERVLSEHAAR